MGTFFKINSHWYNISNEFMSALVDSASSISPTFNRIGKTAIFGVPDDLKLLLDGKSEDQKLIAILGGNLQSVQQVFPNISISLSKVFPELLQSNEKSKYLTIDYEVLISASYRVTLGRPQEMFKNMADELMDSLELGTKSLETFVKIGVHIRLSFDEGKGIQKGQIKCFVSQILTIIRNCEVCKPHKTLIFVASNSKSITKDFAIALQGVARVFDADWIREKYHLPINHLDKSKFSINGGQRWLEASSTYLDWYILSRYMDFLIITRSGFSQTAALYSLVPTFQFDEKNKTFCYFNLFIGNPSQHSFYE